MKTIDQSSPAQVAAAVDFCMANIEASPDLHFAGRFYEELGLNLRAMGIAYLLVYADPDAFYHELTLGGQARRHYLARCAKDGHADFYGATSRGDGFFDALAAKDLGLARDIGLLSPAAWRAKGEYEDDFCYVRFLQRFIAPDPDPAELAALLVQFERALDGAPSVRIDVCRALWSRDPAAWKKAFAALLDAREAEVAEERDGIAAEDLAAALRTHVFVEGLALLFIAEGLGLRTAREYPLCPALARVPRAEASPPDPFPPP
jgi:hypothetical protein